MKLFMIISILTSGYALSEPAIDSATYHKTLLWAPDRAQTTPFWTRDRVDLSIHFRHLLAVEVENAEMRELPKAGELESEKNPSEED